MKKATSEFSQHHKTRQPNEKAQKAKINKGRYRKLENWTK